MTLKQLKAKYAGSRLGIWWAVVTPLLLAASINFVFSSVFKVASPNYALFVLSGIIPWLFFTNAMAEAANSFIVNSSLLRQAVFPRELIPVSSIAANLFNFIIGLIFLLPLFILVNFKTILLLPALAAIIMLHLLFMIGLGTVFSLVNVFFRDLSHFLSIGFMVWFWITPVFYSSTMLPFPFRWICIFNPMTYYVVMYQKVLFEAKLPEAPLILSSVLISVACFFSGYLVFIKKEALLLKRI